MEKLLLRPTEAADQLGITRSKLYELLASGEVPSIKIGKSRRIPADALKKWVNEQMAAQSKTQHDTPQARRKSVASRKQLPGASSDRSGSIVELYPPAKRAALYQKTAEQHIDPNRIEAMQLSTRVTNALLKAGLTTRAQLEELTDREWRNIRNLGACGVAEVRAVLAGEAPPEKPVREP